MFNTTYKICYAEGDSYVLRVGPVNRERLLPYENNLMQGESYFYELCAKQNLPVPKIIVLNTEKNIIDRDFMLVEYIDSIPMIKIPLLLSRLKNFDFIIGKFAKNLKEIRGEKFGRLADISYGIAFDKWSDCVLNEVERTIVKCREFYVLSEDELQKIRFCFITNKNLLDEIKTPSLIHGDLWAGNILLNKDKKSIAAVIDGDRSFFGDSDLELFTAWLNKKQFEKGYELKNKSPNDTKRRYLYEIMIRFTELYVWKIEYTNDKKFIQFKKMVLSLVEKFLKTNDTTF